MPSAVGTDMENLTKDSSVKWRLLFKLCFFSFVIGTVIFIKSKDGMRGSSTYNPYYSQPEKINPYSKYPAKLGCVFPMVIWPAFHMGQYRANDHPYHAAQFRILPRCNLPGMF